MNGVLLAFMWIFKSFIQSSSGFFQSTFFFHLILLSSDVFALMMMFLKCWYKNFKPFITLIQSKITIRVSTMPNLIYLINITELNVI